MNPKAALHRTSAIGMCQTSIASNPAVPRPHAEANRPLLRRPPIKTSTRIRGSAATSADSTMECSGSSGCGQITASAYLNWGGPPHKTLESKTVTETIPLPTIVLFPRTGNRAAASSKYGFFLACRFAGVGGYGAFRTLVHVELENVWSRVMAYNIQVVLAADDLPAIDLGSQ